MTGDIDNLPDEVRDLKRAYCQVMELTNAHLGALTGAVAGCAAPLWLIVVLLAVGIWRIW